MISLKFLIIISSLYCSYVGSIATYRIETLQHKQSYGKMKSEDKLSSDSNEGDDDMLPCRGM